MVDDFRTPQLRQGPTSRLLRRQSDRISTINPSRLSTSVRVLDESDVTFGRGDESVCPPYRVGSSSVILEDTLLPYNGGRMENSSILSSAEENPGVAATENLFVDFLATCSESVYGFKVLDQVAEFEQLSGDHAEALKRLMSKYPGAATKFQVTSLVMENLKNERNTWRLLGKLYHDRIQHPDEEDEEMEGEEEEEETESGTNLSEKLLVEKLFKKNRELREAQAVVDWLETNADDEIYKSKADNFSDATVSWENTLHSLTHPNKTKRNNNLVTELDPDAPRRQSKSLHDLDVQDQAALFNAIFMCIRSGMLETAQDLCVKLGQPWRAATLEGWKLFHDENYFHSDSTKKIPCEGNKTRDIWKRSAWKMTSDPKMPIMEQAAYSAFCGNVRQLLSICKTWDDCLWALTRCYVDMAVEKEIRNKMSHRKFASLPQEYWDDNKDSMSKVLESMESLEKENVKIDKMNPYRVIQCFIISHDYKGLLQKMTEWVKEPQDSHLLRLLCHLIIVHKRLNIAQDDDEVRQMEDVVIEVYVIHLMSFDRIQQVAWYTSQLPMSTQIDLYSKFLEKVYSYIDRKLCLDLGMESDLPIEDITTRVVVNIRTQEEAEDEEATFQPVTTERDLRKVDALEWLIFFDSQRDEAVFQCNALIRAFIAAGKLGSANEAYRKISEDSVSLIRNQHGELESLPPRIANALREFLGHQSYLSAQEAFSDWFNHYSKGQPRKPVLADKASFVEKVAFEQREEQYQIEMERWNSAQLIQSRAATERLYAVLKFPQGWLIDETEEDSEENLQRKEELDYLRRVCLPKLVLLLHSVLHNTRQFQEALKLADLVASERYEIYALYDKDKLRELLNKIGESSVAAMETSSMDPWGYKTK